MVKKRSALATLLAAALILGGCIGNNKAVEAAETEAEAVRDAGDDVLVVGYSNFSSKFSPFFAETAYDQDAQLMTQVALITTDRVGQVIYNGIEGETNNYNGTDYTYYGPADITVTENEDGTVYYDFRLRDDIVFSDGEPMTIDDVIFNMYVLCDPTYDGSSTLFSMPIQGLAEYRSGMETLFNLLIAAGEDNTDFSLWDEETQTAFWEDYGQASDAFAQAIVDACIGYGINTEEDSVAACAANWGYELEEDATLQDFYAAMVEAYGGDVNAMSATEKADDDSTIASLMKEYDAYTVGVDTGASAEAEVSAGTEAEAAAAEEGSTEYITGIQKVDDYSMRVVATQVDATLIYQLALYIAPMHYYGDKEQYDYDAHQFGFPKGDLSMIRAKTTEPMGAGPYKFIQFKDGTINYEANENYYLGAPKIKYMNFRESLDTDKMNGVVTGTLDVTDPSFSKDIAQAITDANGGAGVTGDVITTSTVDNLGYGYIGINTHNVKVGDDPGSDESKALRHAIATVLSVYRDVAIDSYYGDAAEVINYPISSTSWAAPQPADEGYELAFSEDADGNPVYTSDMSAEDKYDAALAASLTWFEKAGYTVEDGKLTEAPEGASLEYEAMIPADGSGDHPAFMILDLAKDAFETIGFNLIITDLSNSADLWTALEAGDGEIWCAAWGATIDPDMYQVYYSDIANGGKEPGGSNYMYQIEDPELDELIMAARMSLDQTYRKTIYKQCLDTIISWACEVPTYQRQNAVIFSTQRVNIDTVTPDITTFYNWYAEIENMEMAAQ